MPALVTSDLQLYPDKTIFSTNPVFPLSQDTDLEGFSLESLD